MIRLQIKVSHPVDLEKWANSGDHFFNISMTHDFFFFDDDYKK